MMKRALHLWGDTERNGHLPLGKARRTCVGACVGSYIPYETGHPVEGQPNLGKIIELTMNNGFDPRTKKQIGPKTGDPETSRTSRNCTRPSRSSFNSARTPSAWVPGFRTSCRRISSPAPGARS
jgi:hypothetical protein